MLFSTKSYYVYLEILNLSSSLNNRHDEKWHQVPDEVNRPSSQYCRQVWCLCIQTSPGSIWRPMFQFNVSYFLKLILFLVFSYCQCLYQCCIFHFQNSPLFIKEFIIKSKGMSIFPEWIETLWKQWELEAILPFVHFVPQIWQYLYFPTI